MARTIAPSAMMATYNGAHGNLSSATGEATLSAAAINDEFVLVEFSRAIVVVDFHAIFDNLGAGTSIELVLEEQDVDADPSDALNKVSLGTITTTSAGNARMTIKPKTVNKTRSKLIAVVKGAVASGDFCVTVNYTSHD